ncbi:MAG: PLP-dependent aminotransferase family protein [Bacteroidota bacterium]
MNHRTDAPLIDLVADFTASLNAVGPTKDGASQAPLYHRLRDHLRALILREHLSAGARLPASRVLARDLGVSRTTVELAYDELVAEGFVARRRGAGTFVVDLLPTRPTPPALPEPDASTLPSSSLSTLGHRLTTLLRYRDAPETPVGFAPCLPSDDVFPLAAWNRLVTAVLHERGRDLQRSSPLLGDVGLRTALADHLARTRRVQCTPAQLLIVTSTQQALSLLARVLVDPGDAVWMEDPAYLGARAAFADARLVPVPVDDDGLDVKVGLDAVPDACLAYVTPSHQYPTGVTLSAERRVALLDWAAQTGAWIVEDDYDSEFRHVGQPLAPLQSFDRAGRVIYVGTFNKVLFPGLRLGYVVLPESLVDVIERAVEAFGGQPSALVQATVAAFVERGHFAAHLRRTREVYRRRRTALLDAAQTDLGTLVTLGPTDTGLHVCARLPAHTNDLAVSARAAAAGLHVPPLSPCYVGPMSSPGLLLGYAGVNEHALRRGVAQLTLLLRSASSSPTIPPRHE